MLEQYGRRSNIEITGIPDTVQNNELENKVIEIFEAIGVETNQLILKIVIELGSPRTTLKKS